MLDVKLYIELGLNIQQIFQLLLPALSHSLTGLWPNAKRPEDRD